MAKNKYKKSNKPEIACSYCHKKSFYLYHRNKKKEINWALCFKCFKKFCDRILGEGKDAGRVE